MQGYQIQRRYACFTHRTLHAICIVGTWGIFTHTITQGHVCAGVICRKTLQSLTRESPPTENEKIEDGNDMPSL